MKKILVTGGAGYIGSHVCKMLAAANYEPITYDNLSNGHEEFVKWGPLEVGDILEKSRLEEVCRKYSLSAVIHLAGLIEVGVSYQQPELFWKNNVDGTANLLDVITENQITNLIFSSTCAIYEETNLKISETTPIKPVSPYAKTKAHVEMLLETMSATNNLRYKSLRYFNAAGASPDLDIGESHVPETHLIPLACYTAMGLNEKFSIFGNDYPTPDGTCVRDYIHVSDIANAHVLALEALLQGESSRAYNIGCGRGYSVRQILNTINNISGANFEIIQKERRSGDAPCLIADNSRAFNELGWTPKTVGIEEIIQSAWAWHNHHHSLN